MIDIVRLTESSPTALNALIALGRALHEDDRSMSLPELEALVRDENVILMVVRDDGRIIGMGTLYVLPKIGRRNGLLEDVIVSSEYRGQGLGERLVRAILDIAREHGVASVTLTSRPVRVAAHKLYQKLGFSKRETDVFRLAL